MRFLSLLYLSFALPFTSVFAGQTVTVQLANDQSGANADKKIPENGKSYLVRNIWGNSVLAQSGGIFATSAQLTAFQQNSVCTIKGPQVNVELDSRKTWTFLAGGKIVNLWDAFVSCRHS